MGVSGYSGMVMDKASETPMLRRPVNASQRHSQVTNPAGLRGGKRPAQPLAEIKRIINYANRLYHILAIAAALAGGAFIGLAFGAIQKAAAAQESAAAKRRPIEQRVGCGARLHAPGRATCSSPWPACKLICPLLFTNGSQWWVSGGVVAGYGCDLVAAIAPAHGGLSMMRPPAVNT